MSHLLFPGPRWASGAILLLCVAGTQHPSIRRPPAQQYRAPSGAQTGAQSSAQEPSQNEAQVPKPKSAPPPTNPRIINSDAWKLLADGAASEKSSQRSDAISAVATIGTESRAIRLVEKALEDKDTGVRILAATALGEMKSHRSIPRLREALDDPADEVQFAAARSLWTMGDYSGEGILVEILAGERHAGPGVVRGRINDAKKKLHNPAALALLSVNEAAGALLGPFAMGVSVIEAFAKDNSAPTRALCATLLASDNSPDSIHELEDALGDKNWVVRAAAAKALGYYPRKRVIPNLQEMLQDDKGPVRFMAAASLVRLTRRNVKIVAITRQTLPYANLASATTTPWRVVCRRGNTRSVYTDDRDPSAPDAVRTHSPICTIGFSGRPRGASKLDEEGPGFISGETAYPCCQAFRAFTGVHALTSCQFHRKSS